MDVFIHSIYLRFDVNPMLWAFGAKDHRPFVVAGYRRGIGVGTEPVRTTCAAVVGAYSRCVDGSGDHVCGDHKNRVFQAASRAATSQTYHRMACR